VSESRLSARGRFLDGGCIALALAAALTMYWVAEWHIVGTVGFRSFPLDDSWIHLHFARNLAEGWGFAYNPGVPVAGSTAPLWTLLLAGAFAVAGSAPGWAKGLGIAAALATALLTRRLVWLWTGSRALALSGGIVAAVSGPLVWGALSGMEVSLAALLVTAAVVLHVTGRDPATALLLGLGALARPETLLLVPLVWLARPITRRRTAIFAGLVGACLAPWIAFNLATAGTPLPATASAKVEGGLIGALSGSRDSLATAFLWRPGQFEAEWLRWLFSVDVLVPVLALPGLWWLWRSRGREWGLPALILILHPIGMALLAPYRGPGFQEGRYSIHLLPLAIAVALAGVQGLTASGSGVGWRRHLRLALAAGLVAAACWTLPGAANRYAWAVQNIDAMQVHLGRWIAANTPPEARLALNDVGAIAYLSRREVVDMMGLVTPAIIAYRKEGEPGVLRYLEGACPDYLVIFPAWFPALSAMTDRFRPIYRVKLDHNTVAGADEMVIYTTPWTGAGAGCR
jgi:hypothetical protein